jgi:RNA polymerase-associated protein RTF1
MVKRKSAALLDSESESNGSGSAGSDHLAKEMLSLSKKKKSSAGSTISKVKTPVHSDSDSSDSDSDWGSKSKGKKNKKKKMKKRTNRRSISIEDNSSDESDGDTKTGNSPPPRSMVSDATGFSSKKDDLEEGEVSSSDGDDSSSDEFDDGYDEHYMGDAEDRQRMDTLTEKEREQEIFKRAERRDVLKSRFEIEKKLRQAKKKELKRQQKAEQGTSASSKFSKVDAKERSKERKKTVEGKVDKKSQAMDMLKARREAKKERDEEREKEKQQRVKVKEDRIDADFDLDLVKPEGSTVGDKASKKKVKISDIYSDDDDSNSDASDASVAGIRKDSDASRTSSDSEIEDDTLRRPEYVEFVRDLEKIRLSRSKIEKWVHFPFFSKVCKGCFIRLGIGQHQGKPVYRVAEVLNVIETSKVYQLGSTRTNKAFRVRHATDERDFRLEFISTNEFTESEFTKWKDACEEKGIVRPTLEDIDRKARELQEANHYQFKEADVDQIIQEKQKFKQNPVNYAVRKTELMKERENATQRGEDKKAEELSRAIAELDERAKELDKLRSSSLKNISYINERNRKKNVEEAEKAIMEEIKASKGLKVQDPFTRRNTKPIMVHRPLGFLEGLDAPSATNSPTPATDTTKLGDETISEDTPDAADIPVIDILEDKPISEILNLDLNGDIRLALATELKGESRPFTTGDLFSAHDFEIKLELDSKLPPNLPIVARPSVQQIREPTPRRSLNLEDYKRKRGLI